MGGRPDGVAALWSELVLVLAELGGVSESDDLASLLVHGPQAGLRVLAATADRATGLGAAGRELHKRSNSESIRSGLALFKSYLTESHKQDTYQINSITTEDGESVTIDNEHEFFLKYLTRIRAGNIQFGANPVFGGPKLTILFVPSTPHTEIQ